MIIEKYTIVTPLGTNIKIALIMTQTLLSLFHRAAGNKASSTLFADEKENCSGEKALQTVQAIAGGLSALPVTKGERIAFLCDNSVRYVLSFFACQQMGAIPCALHVRSTINDIAHTLQWLDASAVIVDSKYRKLLNEALTHGKLSAPLIVLDNPDKEEKTTSYVQLIDSPPLQVDINQVPLHEPSMIILSSGTTGAPKGIMHSQATLYASAIAGELVFGKISSNDSTIIAMAPSFAAWNHVLFPFLAHGAKIVFIRSFDAELFINTISNEKITHAALVPTAWRRALSAVNDNVDLSHFRALFFSGEAATTDFIDKVKAELPAVDIRTAYLSSEGGDASSCMADNDLLSSGKLSVGLPIDGAQVKIIAPTGAIDDVLDVGETGEIAVKSESLALGYWQNANLSAERFVDGWWRSGDMGRMDDEGNLIISGRNDNLIISGGLKVHAEEVEAALMKHPAIDIAAVVGQPDKEWGQRIEAFVITNFKIREKDILNFCRQDALLSSFKLPKTIHFREALPTGATGKLYRRGLLEQIK
jgi:acyl-CoA synthetase (AMP-forming)/AMP-acid ligase II